MTSKDRKVVRWIVYPLIGLIILECLGVPGVGELVLLSYTLCCGWISFVGRVLPQVRINWPLVISTVLYACMLMVLAHLLLRWFVRQVTNQRLNFRSSLCVVILLLVMFCSGLSAIGLLRQTQWLLESPASIFKPNRYSRESANRAKCQSNLHQIYLAMLMYAGAHDQNLPPDLPTLFRTVPDLTSQIFVCPSSNAEATTAPTTQLAASDLKDPRYCSYIYLGSGHKLDDTDKDEIILLEPLTNHGDEGISVLFSGEGRTEWLDLDEAAALLKIRHITLVGSLHRTGKR